MKFANPFWLSEGRVEIEPVSVICVIVDVWIHMSKSPKSEPMLFEIENECKLGPGELIQRNSKKRGHKTLTVDDPDRDAYPRCATE